MNEASESVLQLASRQAEGQLSPDELIRLQELLTSDERLVDLYTDYLCLHAQLTWDGGQNIGLSDPVPVTDAVDQTQSNTLWRTDRRKFVAVAATLMVLITAWLLFGPSAPDGPNVVDVPAGSDELMSDGNGNPNAASEDVELKPLELAHRPESPAEQSTAQLHQPAQGPADGPTERLPENFSDAFVVARIDELLERSWQEQDVQSASPAGDSEWVRRSYLTLAGRIPTLVESRSFLQNDSPRKRGVLLQDLLSGSEQSEHLATIWTNLLIGRTDRPGVNRDKLFEFLAQSFRQNTPWIDTVTELITASGRNDRNGATNFLLAHLNNQATPATAVTARLFLGEQISCVQCHDHPFSTGVKQEDYWALNAFFKDTVRVTVADDKSKPSAGKSKYITCRLVDRPQVERITHYETRSGQQRAVLPSYDKHVIPEDSKENRRQQLARLLASDSNIKIARAMVNRVWAHFFGYGFTNPVDDMGPHATVSHPELLNLLAEAFVRSDYDVRRLMLWIGSTRAWQLSSEVSATIDMPGHGETPLFTRVYTRRMTPEQVYESIRVAIRSAADQPLEHNTASIEHRRSWVRQFAQNYETDENDESLNFEGTIAQAMVMMNGVEVDEAIRDATDEILSQQSPRSSEAGLLERVAVATLTRPPTQEEKRAFRAHYRHLQQRPSARGALTQALEDMMWAYLNSSEFVLIH
ncbi:MAG: DUF1549 domain-containing protein [Fuerstiella sp.]